MYVYFPKLLYLCTAISKSSFGGLAHLARARHWQCRGDRFESGNLHLIKKTCNSRSCRFFVFQKQNLLILWKTLRNALFLIRFKKYPADGRIGFS
ncbi:MAG: hypothetical protein H6Q20_1340 [Bacteroidetes bacterium]|nr:hypothetical protein [Bacteroidota bacterium]